MAIIIRRWRSAQRRLDAAIAPFAAQAAEFERAHNEANAAYAAGIKPFQDAVLAAQDKTRDASYNGGDVIAAADHAFALGSTRRGQALALCIE